MNWACVQEACGKELAEVIARTLQNMGFKVWLSQDFQTPDGERNRPRSLLYFQNHYDHLHLFHFFTLSKQQINHAVLLFVSIGSFIFWDLSFSPLPHPPALNLPPKYIMLIVAAAEDAMREGVLQSAVVLLLMTHGIFRKERDWVTRVELLSAIAAKKAIIGVNPGACPFRHARSTCSLCCSLCFSSSSWLLCCALLLLLLLPLLLHSAAAAPHAAAARSAALACSQ